MNRSCKHYPYLFFLLVSSCITAPVDNINTKFSLSESISTIGEITNDERIIATRICYAYESKENNLNSLNFQDMHFIFNINKNGCGENEQYDVITSLKRQADGSFKFAQNKEDLYSTIQTSSKGYLSKVCNSIKENKSISNTVEMGTTLIQIHFYKETYDSYILKYFEKGAGESYTPVLFENFNVLTQFNRKSGQILGMDVLYESQKKCDESNDTKIFTQRYKE